MDADPLDEGAAAAMQAAAVATQLAQTLIRQAQEAVARATAEARLDYQEASEHLAAQAEVAAAFYERASATEWISAAEVDEVAAVVQGVHLWAEVNEERFGSVAHKVRDNVRLAHGVDLPAAFTEQANAARLADLARTGITHARALVIHTDPSLGTAAAPAATSEVGTDQSQSPAGHGDLIAQLQRARDLENAPGPATPAAAAETGPSLSDKPGGYGGLAARLQRARDLQAAKASPDYRRGRAAADAMNSHSPLQAAAAGLTAARSTTAGPGLPRAATVLGETHRDR